MVYLFTDSNVKLLYHKDGNEDEDANVRTL